MSIDLGALGEEGSTLIGRERATSDDIAAALAVVPIVIMIFYLLGARALGAFEAV